VQKTNLLEPRYFRKILAAVSSGPFYAKYVRLPGIDDPVSLYISGQKWFTPWFNNAIGAMDGTHINSCPSALDRHASRNRKGGVSQNCLACVSFAMRFLYFLSGWEGSAADAAMYARSRLTDLTILQGKFYLADAGFGICDSLLVPYRGVRYHLAEWGRANLRCILHICDEFSIFTLPISDQQIVKSFSICDMLLHGMSSNVSLEY